jgi:hypothetical protein
MRFLSWLGDSAVGLIVALAGFTSAVEASTAAAVARRWFSRMGSWMSRVAHWVWPDVPDQRSAVQRPRADPTDHGE